MPAPRKLPPAWWLLGYMAQYQRHALLRALSESGLSSDEVYRAATLAAGDLPSTEYRKLSKGWAVRQHRARRPAPEVSTGID